MTWTAVQNYRRELYERHIEDARRADDARRAECAS